MKLTYHIVDVFTDKAFGGNQLAVILDADEVPPATMQAIARELNLSETVFVQAPTRPAHSAKIRIFTPAKELPFAGHPTVGTAALMALLRAPENGHERDALIVLEQEIGTVRVGVRMRSGQAAFAEFDTPKLPAEAGALPPVDKLAAGLGLIPSEIGFENHRPQCFAAGNAFAFVPIASRDAIARAQVSPAHWGAAFQDQGIIGAYLYTRHCLHTTSNFHVRMFAPDVGVPEDPATGSAAVCFAGAIMHFDRLPDGMHRRTIEQGFEMGRPSLISLTLSVEQGKLDNVRIGGHVVPVAEGVISV